MFTPHHMLVTGASPSSGDWYNITLCAAWLMHMAATVLGANPR